MQPRWGEDLKSIGAKGKGGYVAAGGGEIGAGSRGMEVEALLRNGTEALHLNLGVIEIEMLSRYYSELLRWSAKMNLIGKKQKPEQIIENHFLDSLMLLPILQRPGCSLLDVGTGAGFPGLVCKVASPEMELVLVEPRLKRVSFLRHIQRSLKLESVSIYAERIENLNFTKIRCSHVTGRAVAEIGEFVAMIGPALDENTTVVCMKGPKWRQELDEAAQLLADFSLELEGVVERRLPFSDAPRAILTFRRSAS